MRVPIAAGSDGMAIAEIGRDIRGGQLVLVVLVVFGKSTQPICLNIIEIEDDGGSFMRNEKNFRDKTTFNLASNAPIVFFSYATLTQIVKLRPNLPKQS